MKELGKKVLLGIFYIFVCLSFAFYLLPILGVFGAIWEYGVIKGVLYWIGCLLPVVWVLLFLGILAGDFSDCSLVIRLLQRIVRRFCCFAILWLCLDFLIHIDDNSYLFDSGIEQFTSFIFFFVVWVLFVVLSIHGVKKDYAIIQDAMKNKRESKCSFAAALTNALNNEVPKPLSSSIQPSANSVSPSELSKPVSETSSPLSVVTVPSSEVPPSSSNDDAPAAEIFDIENVNAAGNIQNELDALYTATSEYRKSDNYRRFLALCTTFKRYSAFNTGLVYTQMPGARFYLPRNQWERRGRVVKNDERPLIALQPFAPILLLYDVSQTILKEPEKSGFLAEYYKMMEPFDYSEVAKPVDQGKLSALLSNLPYFGILFLKMRTGSLYAGKLQVGEANEPLLDVKWRGKDGKEHSVSYHPPYTLKCGEMLNDASLFPTLVHELGHFFLRHLRCEFDEKWDSRGRLDENTMEFEAESAAWMVCRRMGIDAPSQKYLAEYLNANQSIPPVDVLLIAKVVEQIEALYHPIAIDKGFLYKYNPVFRVEVDKYGVKSSR